MAIEVVRILEASGLRGHLVCIDGAPAFLKNLLLKVIAVDRFSLKKLQTRIIDNIATACLPNVNLDTFHATLNQLEEWKSKMQALIDFLAVHNYSVNEKYLVEAVTGFYIRSKSAFFYTNSEKIKSDITLVRAKEGAISDIDEMYEMPSHTEGSVSLKYVEGNHQTLLETLSLADIIEPILKQS